MARDHEEILKTWQSVACQAINARFEITKQLLTAITKDASQHDLAVMLVESIEEDVEEEADLALIEKALRHSKIDPGVRRIADLEEAIEWLIASAVPRGWAECAPEHIYQRVLDRFIRKQYGVPEKADES